MIYGVGGMLTLMISREAIQTAVYYKAMAADQRALAAIEIDMNKIPEGQVILKICIEIYLIFRREPLSGVVSPSSFAIALPRRSSVRKLSMWLICVILSTTTNVSSAMNGRF
jgi:hypothetical protein